MIKILAASLVGAVLCTVWSAVSWMALQWHATALHEFHDETAVATALLDNGADELKRRGETVGTFILPHDVWTSTPAPKPGDAPPPKSSTARKPPDRSMFAFVILRPGARDVSIPINLAWLLGRSFIACLIIAIMLNWTMRLDYLQRVLFCVLGGLFASFVSEVPLMIWFEMPLRDTFINFADHLCEWSIAGLAIAFFVEGRGMWEHLK